MRKSFGNILISFRKNINLLGLLLLLAISVGFGVLDYKMFSAHPGRFVFDDVFITWRYSQNLAQGYGVLWNLYDPPVEGYTAFLWVIVMAIPMRLNIDPLFASHWLNLILTLGMAVAAVWCLHKVFQATWLSLVSGFSLILFHPLTMENMLSAMETTLFAFFTLITFSFFAVYIEKGNERYLKAGAVAGILCGLTRPDGILFLGIFSAAALFTSKERARAFKTLLLFAGLPGALYLLWKLWYFGSVLPVPFLIKVSPEAFWNFPGRYYIRAAVLQTSYGPLMSLMALLAFSFRGNRWSLRILFLAVAGIWLFYSMSYPMLGVHNRFLYASFMLLSIAVAVGIEGLLTLAHDQRHLRLFAPLAACFIFAWNIYYFYVDVFSNKNPDLLPAYLLEYQALGKSLASIPNADKVSIAYGDAGMIAYASKQVSFFDTLGLNDRYVAEHLSDIDSLVNYFYQRSPDLVAFYVFPQPNGQYVWGAISGLAGEAGSRAIIRDPRFARYQPLGKLRAEGLQQTFHYWMYIFLKRDSVAAMHLRQALQPLIEEADIPLP